MVVAAPGAQPRTVPTGSHCVLDLLREGIFPSPGIHSRDPAGQLPQNTPGLSWLSVAGTGSPVQARRGATGNVFGVTQAVSWFSQRGVEGTESPSESCCGKGWIKIVTALSQVGSAVLSSAVCLGHAGFALCRSHTRNVAILRVRYCTIGAPGIPTLLLLDISGNQTNYIRIFKSDRVFSCKKSRGEWHEKKITWEPSFTVSPIIRTRGH